MSILRSATRQAIATLEQRRQSLVGPGATADQLAALADELYSVAGLLSSQSRLRRTLGDPATSASSRVQLVSDLLSGKVGANTLEVVAAAVEQRWSSPWDLTDALEASADDALFAAADTQGVLGTVEDELFRFERVLEGAGELTALLDERSADTARRVGLLESVLGGKVHPITAALLRQAVRSDRKRSVTLAIDDLLEAATTRQSQSLARVTSAVELTDQQQQRLGTALSSLYDRPISIRTAIDPQVGGGLVVRVGDEVIDGSIASRLIQARIALVG